MAVERRDAECSITFARHWNVRKQTNKYVIGIALEAFGMLTPIRAITFQEAGCVTVVFSSMQLLWAKPQLARLASANET